MAVGHIILSSITRDHIGRLLCYTTQVVHQVNKKIVQVGHLCWSSIFVYFKLLKSHRWRKAAIGHAVEKLPSSRSICWRDAAIMASFVAGVSRI